MNSCSVKAHNQCSESVENQIIKCMVSKFVVFDI